MMQQQKMHQQQPQQHFGNNNAAQMNPFAAMMGNAGQFASLSIVIF